MRSAFLVPLLLVAAATAQAQSAIGCGSPSVSTVLPTNNYGGNPPGPPPGVGSSYVGAFGCSAVRVGNGINESGLLSSFSQNDTYFVAFLCVQNTSPPTRVPCNPGSYDTTNMTVLSTSAALAGSVPPSQNAGGSVVCYMQQQSSAEFRWDPHTDTKLWWHTGQQLRFIDISAGINADGSCKGDTLYDTINHYSSWSFTNGNSDPFDDSGTYLVISQSDATISPVKTALRYTIASKTLGPDLVGSGVSGSSAAGHVTLFDAKEVKISPDGTQLEVAFPFTASVSSEAYGTGNGGAGAYTYTLNPTPHEFSSIQTGTVTVTAGAQHCTDNGSGGFGAGCSAGSINYTTGAVSVTFNSAVGNGVMITVAYSYTEEATELYTASTGAFVRAITFNWAFPHHATGRDSNGNFIVSTGTANDPAGPCTYFAAWAKYQTGSAGKTCLLDDTWDSGGRAVLGGHYSINNQGYSRYTTLNTSEADALSANPLSNFASVWVPYANELVLVQLDGLGISTPNGTGTAIRLIHHLSRDTGFGYENNARATISRSGKYVLYSSNFGQEAAGTNGMWSVYLIALNPSVPALTPQLFVKKDQ